LPALGADLKRLAAARAAARASGARRAGAAGVRSNENASRSPTFYAFTADVGIFTPAKDAFKACPEKWSCINCQLTTHIFLLLIVEASVRGV
jgi:hypothetical protein